MKRLFNLFLTLLFLFNPVLGWTTNYCNDANVQGCWLFNEGSGTTVDDSSTNSNTLNFKATGEPAWATENPPAAYVTNYVVFDGSNDYTTAIDDNSLDISSSFTITMWIRPDFIETANPPEYAYIISKGANYSSHFNSYVDDFRLTQNAGGLTNTDTVGLTWASGSWHIIQMTFHVGTNPDVVIYWDGVSSGNNSGAFANPTGVTNDLYVGSGALAVYWKGGISETALFSRELTTTEMNDIKDNGLAGAAVARRTWVF